MPVNLQQIVFDLRARVVILEEQVALIAKLAITAAEQSEKKEGGE